MINAEVWVQYSFQICKEYLNIQKIDAAGIGFYVLYIMV